MPEKREKIEKKDREEESSGAFHLGQKRTARNENTLKKKGGKRCVA